MSQQSAIESTQSTQQKKLSKTMTFILSASAGMVATSVVQPVDLVKTRMQLSGMAGAAKEHKTFVHAFVNVIKREGFPALYNGLSAGLFRQITYTGTRLGLFNYLEDTYKGMYNHAMPIYVKLGCGLFAGGCGAVVGTPAEVALIRMTADGRLKLEERRGYRNVAHALVDITKKEGVASLWTGVGPTVTRALVLNAVQLSTYSEMKETLLKTKYFNDNIYCHFVASLMSGFMATAISTPVDTVKTRIQSSKGEFRGVLDVVIKATRQEGPFSLMKGFVPFFLRLGPHTIITFMAFEQFKAAVQKF